LQKLSGLLFLAHPVYSSMYHTFGVIFYLHNNNTNNDNKQTLF